MAREKGRIKDYRDLEIWQRGVELVVGVYRASETFPRHELYGLVSQMRRAAVSIPSNIAEGFGRFHRREYKQHLHVSLGRCAELNTQLILAGRLGYMQEGGVTALCKEIDEISRMIMTLTKRIECGNT